MKLPSAEQTEERVRRLRLTLELVLVVVGLGLLGSRLGVLEAAVTRYHRADPPGASIVLIVLDTLRADRLSLCGYGRPTSPTLEKLRDRGAAWSCAAVAPGSWTLPSHASFFTGVEVPEHGTHFVEGGKDIHGLVIRPLPESFQTLAEEMRGSGYQTLGVSGNPVLRPASGLTQGFAAWRSAPLDGAWYGPQLVDQVRAGLRELDGDGAPLFLFVNVFDAHDPWAPVPTGLDWLPPRSEGLGFFLSPEPAEWEAYVTGRMQGSEAEAFRARLGDLYDFGVRRADWTLGRVLEVIEDHGWFDAGMRLVVVSDHGEFLGEHGLARHGRYVWEPNQRVPLLVLDTEREVELPSPVSALHVFTLVRNGGLPDPLSPPLGVAFPDGLWLSRSGGVVGGSTSAALWSGSEKLVWIDGKAVRYDLAEDPEEANPLPLGAHPLAPDLLAYVRSVRASQQRDAALSPELHQALRAMGYLE
jgi:hypothetical protein